jgi:hypothetical protein
MMGPQISAVDSWDLDDMSLVNVLLAKMSKLDLINRGEVYSTTQTNKQTNHTGDYNVLSSSYFQLRQLTLYPPFNAIPVPITSQ